jgi:hypothetical protein
MRLLGAQQQLTDLLTPRRRYNIRAELLDFLQGFFTLSFTQP